MDYYTNNATLQGENFFSKAIFPFHIHRYLISKETIIPQHSHDFFELVYVISGDAVHYIEDKAYSLVPGNIFILEPDVSHRFNASSNQDTVVFNVLFKKEFLQKEITSLSTIPSFINFFYLLPFLRKNHSFIPYLPLKSTQKYEVEHHLNTLHQEYTQQIEGYELLIKTRLIEILVVLSRYYKENQQKTPILMNEQEAIHSIKQFIKKHNSEPIRLAHLSQAYGMSMSSLTAKFKKHTGKTLIEYKHTTQIQQACEELQNEHKKIATIALDCGFNDISHFNRLFKKYVGSTPREYRKKWTLS